MDYNKWKKKQSITGFSGVLKNTNADRKGNKMTNDYTSISVRSLKSITMIPMIVMILFAHIVSHTETIRGMIITWFIFNNQLIGLKNIQYCLLWYIIIIIESIPYKKATLNVVYHYSKKFVKNGYKYTQPSIKVVHVHNINLWFSKNCWESFFTFYKTNQPIATYLHCRGRWWRHNGNCMDR